MVYFKKQRKLKKLVSFLKEWAKQCVSDGRLTKGKTLLGLNYCINQEKYLRVFLAGGDVPIDNLASERAIRPFTIGRNYVL